MISALILSLGIVHAAPADISRAALIIGQGQGFADETPLRYAERDAERVAAALQQLGRFDSLKLLKSPSRDQVLAAIDALPQEVGLLVFYYSGHAARGKLHLAGDELSGTTILDALDAKSPGLRVAVVDACDSGDLTVRTKGLSATLYTDAQLLA